MSPADRDELRETIAETAPPAAPAPAAPAPAAPAPAAAAPAGPEAPAPASPPRPRRPDPSTEEFQLSDVWESLAARRPHRAVLAILRGPDLGAHFEVGVDPILLGRDPECHAVLQGQGISRRHVEIRQRQDGGHEVADQGSRNGTLLNGRRLEASAWNHLGDGDQLLLGDTLIEYVVEDPDKATYRDEMGKLANIDDLTGLLVKRRFDAAFEGAVRTAARGRGAIGVLMIDMDGLRAINDAHGHLHGAHSIGEVGKILGRELGALGVASRFGGDEFCVFLRGSQKPAAVLFGEHLRKLVEAHVFELDGIRVTPTLSVGVASFPEDGDTPQALLGAADAALYRAKRAGRNRVST